jgi:hypothetical protein
VVSGELDLLFVGGLGATGYAGVFVLLCVLNFGKVLAGNRLREKDVIVNMHAMHRVGSCSA